MRRAILICGLAAIACCAGCKKADMYEQQSYRTDDRDPGLPGETTEQNPVAGTVAQEEPGKAVKQPERITAVLLARGQQRYDIFCAPCHGASGDGDGMIVRRGFPRPPDLASERILHEAASQLYDTIGRGKGDMYGFAGAVPPADRWAIAAYIRALQLSRHAVIASLPAQDQARITGAAAP
jgi:mono/diheme cytochrome c family protein